MYLTIGLSLLVCVLALIFTIMVGLGKDKSDYNQKKSWSMVSWTYIVLFPVSFLALGLLYYFITR
ncbi:MULTISPECIES: hypothetical protein [Exiguobacterium]|jgi:uncharacterized membrane protein|uniref:Uncharacterized protein n=2 Tax=Exiguobacterium TaxID=33986 RepID=U1N076_9BACL|nr:MULTISPECIES: hypothetical protein [Exiguobacterium]ERG66125.1 hypothetical protein M467_02425 [Exiguobacterium chiriqhucha RW-2]KAB2861168.1 MAG: hypothetical protein F9K39_13925 [Exiguobacterium chiriqhucha]MDL5375502.1 hypothetical protein [Exiguobacterium mexicanum]TCI68983.1 hypothetical protein EVJ19_10430 [Exiguobacterium sp. IPCI3]TCI78480.1 hypothetical protein EVJ18_10430 [Exiguobacterium sp. IPCH1]